MGLFFTHHFGCIGFDFSDYSIEAVQLEKKKNSDECYDIKAWSRVILERGVIKNGLIKNSQKLVKIIREMLQKPKMGGFNQHCAAFAVPESLCFIEEFVFPNIMSDKQLRDFFSKKTDKVFPLDSDDIIWDYKICQKQVDHLSVNLVAVSSKAFKDYYNVFKEVGLEVIFADSESGSIIFPLNDLPEDNPVMVFDFGAYSSFLFVYDQFVIRNSMDLFFGGQSISGELSKKLKINLKDADKKKREQGLQGSGKEDVRNIIIGQINPLLDQLKSSAADYKHEYQREIKLVAFIGGESLIPGLTSYMQKILGLKVVPYFMNSIKKNLRLPAIWPVVFPSAMGIAQRSMAKGLGRNNGVNFLRNIDWEFSKTNKSSFQ